MTSVNTPDSVVKLHPPGDRPDVAVDLSNVCRDERLGCDGSHWARYLRLLAALEHRLGRPPKGIAFADASLRPRLSNRDARAFDADEQRGCLRVVRGDADVEILAYARDTGARVVSRDRFLGHRAAHPWIQGDADRFIGWKPKGDRLVLFSRRMGVRSPFTISEGEESDRMKGAQVDPSSGRDREVLGHAFRCENGSCGLARRFPDHLAQPPSLRRGMPTCPECGHELLDLGPRAASTEFVLEVGDVELRRISLVPGDGLVLGRRELEGPARRWKVAERIGRVSREHLSLSVGDDGDVVAKDLGSRNGSHVSTWDAARGGWGEPRRLPPSVDTRLSARDAVMLAGVVRVRRSGQHFPLAERGKPIVLGEFDAVVTRIVDDEEDDA